MQGAAALLPAASAGTAAEMGLPPRLPSVSKFRKPLPAGPGRGSALAEPHPGLPALQRAAGPPCPVWPGGWCPQTSHGPGSAPPTGQRSALPAQTPPPPKAPGALPPTPPDGGLPAHPTHPTLRLPVLPAVQPATASSNWLPHRRCPAPQAHNRRVRLLPAGRWGHGGRPSHCNRSGSSHFTSFLSGCIARSAACTGNGTDVFFGGASCASCCCAWASRWASVPFCRTRSRTFSTPSKSIISSAASAASAFWGAKKPKR